MTGTVADRLHRPVGRRLLRPRLPDSHPHLDLGLNQLRLIKTAFACDLVRVATFMWSAGTNWVVFPGTLPGRDDQGQPRSRRRTTRPATATRPATPGPRDWLNQINTFYSAATATALQEFATTPDIDGNMLIDNTVIVYLTEVARAWDHNQQNMPLIVFGGKNTGVAGRHLPEGRRAGRCPTQTGGTGNRPFNDFWLSLLPVFGVNGSVLSGASGALQSTGALPGVFS